MDFLKATREFWNSNPCDGQEDIYSRMVFRYKKEPWIPALLDEIICYNKVLEIGCGQGTDTLYCCQPTTGDCRSYVALDLSPKSIESAKSSTDNIRSSLKILPVFQVGNAEELDFADNSFDCVFSLGVLHHTPNIDKALKEVHRVLKNDGKAIIALYRIWSPKVFIAQSIRSFLNCFDSIGLHYLRKNLLKALDKIGTNHRFGTMFHECIGVPVLHSYTKNTLKRKFAEFRKVEIDSRGAGLGVFTQKKLLNQRGKFLGAFWLVKAIK